MVIAYEGMVRLRLVWKGLMLMKLKNAMFVLVALNVMLLVALVVDRREGTSPLGVVEGSAFAQAEFATSATARQAPRTQKRRTEIVEAAERVSPSIVSVGASRTTLFINPNTDFFQRYLIYPYQERIPYLGSGVVVSKDGLIVTNYHVVDKVDDIFVTLMDGRELPAKLVDADPLVDVAVLRVEATNLQPVKMGDSNDILVGEWVLAMGNPFGNLIGDPKPSVTLGVVSATQRTFRSAAEAGKVYNDMIQTDAAINPGNSGGALINSDGELVGINTFIMSRSGGSEGIGFAIPVNRVKAAVDEVVKYKRIRSRMVDFAVQTVTPRIAGMLGAKATSGALVSELVKRGPGEKAGLRVGDIITNAGMKLVRDARDLELYLWTQPVGTKVPFSIDRGGKIITAEYELTEGREN